MHISNVCYNLQDKHCMELSTIATGICACVLEQKGGHIEHILNETLMFVPQNFYILELKSGGKQV